MEPRWEGAHSYGALQQLEGNPQICQWSWSIFLTVPSVGAPWRVPLAARLSCRSCQYCSGAGTVQGWCRLRRLEVHADVADLVVCHHWTPRSPELPAVTRVMAHELDQQLELDRALA